MPTVTSCIAPGVLCGCVLRLVHHEWCDGLQRRKCLIEHSFLFFALRCDALYCGRLSNTTFTNLEKRSKVPAPLLVTCMERSTVPFGQVQLFATATRGRSKKGRGEWSRVTLLQQSIGYTELGIDRLP